MDLTYWWLLQSLEVLKRVECGFMERKFKSDWSGVWKCFLGTFDWWKAMRTINVRFLNWTCHWVRSVWLGNRFELNCLVSLKFCFRKFSLNQNVKSKWEWRWFMHIFWKLKNHSIPLEKNPKIAFANDMKVTLDLYNLKQFEMQNVFVYKVKH